MPRPSKHDVGFSFAVVLLGGYMAFGVALNRWVPIVDVDAWFALFMWGNWVRGAALALLLYIDFRTGRRDPFDISGMPARRCLAHAALVLALWGVFMTQATGAPWPGRERAAGIAACLLVGAFEEYLFRGILLSGLLRRAGPRAAVLGTSLLFTLFHTRVQAIAAWPHIFLTGTVFANLRPRG
ncbi:MAG: CPBP family intramembrane glutamic endopeptidase [Elusimicrobiota bacterium]